MTSGRGRATNRIGVGKYRMTTYFALLEIVIIDGKEIYIYRFLGSWREPEAFGLY